MLSRRNLRPNRKTTVAAVAATAAVALCLFLYHVPGPASWGWARLVLVGALPVTLGLALSVPFYLVTSGRRRRENIGAENAVVWGFLGLTAFFSAILVLASAVHPTAYEPAVSVGVAAAGWGLVLGVYLVAARKEPGPSRRVLGPLRAWHLGVLVNLAVLGAALPLARYNPTLRHRTFALQVDRATSMVGVSAGARCKLDVGWFKDDGADRCWINLWCGGRRLYGGYKLGVVDCQVSADGLNITAEDRHNDGDPKLKLDTARGRLALAHDTNLDRDPALTAHLNLEAP